MTTVFFQGAFDLLNAGHVRAFRLAKEHGYLVVGLNTDELMRWYKREPIIPFVQRREILSGIRYIDDIIECHEPAAIRYLKQLKADVYVLTEEWAQAQKEAIDWIEGKGGKIILMPRFDDIYDSTTIRARVKGAA
jgi:cytidyltransferase-like protein